MSYYVYVLISTYNNKLFTYVGYTINLKKGYNCIIVIKEQNILVEKNGKLFIVKNSNQKI